MSRSSLHYLKPYWLALVSGAVMMIVTNLCYLGIPRYVKAAVDELTAGNSAEVPKAAVLIIVFAVATALTRIVSRVWIFNAARAAEYDVRSELFGHCMTLSPGYYRDHPTGDVMSRLTNDVQVVRAM